ncbi:helix-turn-helix domain-containing protein [Streptomyces sp. NPDC001381]|uniref:helix-turn-helix domain-containing protein n=1 Tax=Streptomyces sp. NPDC001381 TaxID=3364567 RepID=UPI00367AE1DE
MARLIQRRRLEGCARELTRRDAAAATVSAVARSWGFAHPARFSRVFRAAYGRSARGWARSGSFVRGSAAGSSSPAGQGGVLGTVCAARGGVTAGRRSTARWVR